MINRIQRSPSAGTRRADLSDRRLLSGEGGSDNPKAFRQETVSSKSGGVGYRAAVSFNYANS